MASSSGVNFYLKIAVPCFCLGAGMEMFMLKTGFYEKVVDLEAQRLGESREEREEFLKALGEELERQAAEKNIKLNIPKAHSR